jgi:glycosyltransferase involved in cell wall biosynthesis
MGRYVEWGIPPDKIRFEDYGRDSAPPMVDRPRTARNRLGFFGQFSGFKGVDVLIQAMKILRDNARDESARQESPDSLNGDPSEPGRTGLGRITARLALHGANLDLQDGEFQNIFRKLLEETKDTVSLAGRYDRRQLPQLMENIDWVVVPSIWWENSPLVIQEAFLHRRPVICGDIGGMAEKVTDGVNGLHFRTGDAASLAQVLLRAVSSPTLWNELRTGIPNVYTLEAQVSELKNLYRGLVAAGRDRSAHAVAH